MDDQTLDDVVEEAEAAADEHRKALLRLCRECAKKAIPAAVVGALIGAIVILAAMRGLQDPEMIALGAIATMLCIWAVSIGPRHQGRLNRAANTASLDRALYRGELDYFRPDPCCCRSRGGGAAAGAAATTAAAAAIIM